MDYSTLVAELENASRQCGHYTTMMKIRELLAYLNTLQETGNYLLAEQALERVS